MSNGSETWNEPSKVVGDERVSFVPWLVQPLHQTLDGVDGAVVERIPHLQAIVAARGAAGDLVLQCRGEALARAICACFEGDAQIDAVVHPSAQRIFHS